MGQKKKGKRTLRKELVEKSKWLGLSLTRVIHSKDGKMGSIEMVVRCSLTSVFISFLIYLGALHFQKLPVEPDSISIHGGRIDITIIMSLVFCWNMHQPRIINVLL